MAINNQLNQVSLYEGGSPRPITQLIFWQNMEKAHYPWASVINQANGGNEYATE